MEEFKLKIRQNRDQFQEVFGDKNDEQINYIINQYLNMVDDRLGEGGLIQIIKKYGIDNPEKVIRFLDENGGRDVVRTRTAGGKRRSRSNRRKRVTRNQKRGRRRVSIRRT